VPSSPTRPNRAGSPISAEAADTTAGDWVGVTGFSVMVDPFSAVALENFSVEPSLLG
jgi:hypothetical protein